MLYVDPSLYIMQRRGADGSGGLVFVLNSRPEGGWRGETVQTGFPNARFEPVAFHALLFVFAGLAVVRVSLGLMHGDFSAYTLFAMIFETACFLFLVWYLLLKKAVPIGSEPGL